MYWTPPQGLTSIIGNLPIGKSDGSHGERRPVGPIGSRPRSGQRWPCTNPPELLPDWDSKTPRATLVRASEGVPQFSDFEGSRPYGIDVSRVGVLRALRRGAEAAEDPSRVANGEGRAQPRRLAAVQREMQSPSAGHGRQRIRAN